MIKNCLSLLVFIVLSHTAWAIYGPDLARANAAVALRACQEADFQQSREITRAIASHKPDDIVRVLGDAMKEWKETSRTSPLYPARAFCVHELVPEILEPKGGPKADPATWREPTSAVLNFNRVGIEYYYYSPDGAWRPSKNPVDLNQLATNNLNSRWGREAFLMMTQLGWSQGACAEGPDQFREVIKHSEKFLKLYPQSEVSDRIRLELANAYATWWNAANMEPNAYSNPENYKQGAERAKQHPIHLYLEYLKVKSSAKVRKRLNALRENPKGSDTYDYFCEDYED
jgi:hypothetical protein